MDLPHSSDYFPAALLERLDSDEWRGSRTYIRLQCGHEVPVKPGDRVWFYADEDCLMYMAVDPVTIQ